jgi:hypothetical protein
MSRFLAELRQLPVSQLRACRTELMDQPGQLAHVRRPLKEQLHLLPWEALDRCIEVVAVRTWRPRSQRRRPIREELRQVTDVMPEHAGRIIDITQRAANVPT